MQDLISALDKLGLQQYAQLLFDEGFETWDQLMDVTEADLESVGLKMGHRRRLQRAIQDTRRVTGQMPLQHSGTTSTPVDLRMSGDAQQFALEAGSPQDSVTPRDATASQTKRKYRRHPKVDVHAPERPPSAYVLFSNAIRERLKSQNLSFTELAKAVGEQWQDPDPEERQGFEREAQALKDAYYEKLAEYKKTPEYAEYNAYLADFRLKHAEPKTTRDMKRRRPTPDSAVSPPTVSPSLSRDESQMNSRPGLGLSDSKSTRSSIDTASTNGTQGWRSENYSPQNIRFPQPLSLWDSGSTSRGSNPTLSPIRIDVPPVLPGSDLRSRSSSLSGNLAHPARTPDTESGLHPYSSSLLPGGRLPSPGRDHIPADPSAPPPYLISPASRGITLPGPTALLSKPIHGYPNLPSSQQQVRHPDSQLHSSSSATRNVALPPLRHAASAVDFSSRWNESLRTTPPDGQQPQPSHSRAG